jgi:alcohol dehydrogenase
MGGWRIGNTIDGAQAEYLLVPDAMTNLAPNPDGLIDEQVLMCPDIMSTGFSGPRADRFASATRWQSSPRGRSDFAPLPGRV